MFLKAQSISFLISISCSSAMIESFYNLVNFHNYTMDLSTAVSAFHSTISVPGILQSLPTSFYQHPIEYIAFSLDFTGSRCSVENKHLRKHEFLATMSYPGCVRETGTTVARAESGAGDEWDRVAK